MPQSQMCNHSWWDGYDHPITHINVIKDFAKFKDTNLDIYATHYAPLFQDSVAVGDHTMNPLQFQDGENMEGKGDSDEINLADDDGLFLLSPRIVQIKGRSLVAKSVRQRANLDCIGAIDGTHVKASVAQHEQAKYIGRKGYATQNIMAVCDFNMCFTFVWAGWEGTAHDTRIFNEALERSELHFPRPMGEKYFVVDARYPNTRGYLAPYKGATIRYHLLDFQRAQTPALRAPSGEKETFNFPHSSLRNILERTFGVWKARWAILRDMHVNFTYDDQVKIVLASMAMHNYIRKAGIIDEAFNTAQQESYEPTQSTNRNGAQEGPSTRPTVFLFVYLKYSTTMTEQEALIDENFPLFSQKPKTKSSKPVTTPTPTHHQLVKETSSTTHLSFTDLNLPDWALQTCKELGMKKPTPVQQHCIPRILSGEDVLGIAQTGSGKTAAFALPILHRLAENPYGVFCLVVTPTRELAYQLAEQFWALGSCLNLRCAVIVGGMDMITQSHTLMQRPHVEIATPGRIKVLIEQNPDIPPIVSNTKFLVLDEADRVLDTCFEDELRVVFNCLPKKRQTLLFSATMTRNLQSLLEVSANKAYFYEAYQGFQTVDTLKQQYVFIPKNVKDVYLLHILSRMEDMGIWSAIIFVSTCRSCHLFKSGKAPVLLATDVASRGLDIPTVDLVINYDIPRYPRDYVHRVGRTARPGRGGLAISFITQNDVDLIHEIEADLGKKLEKFECKENEVLEDITKVYKAKRVATMKMMDDGFEEKAKARKAHKMTSLADKGLLVNKNKRRKKHNQTNTN
ncbi:hypothetical protein LXL04_000203 [Taraxacum kok-saghyz]